MTAKDMLVLGVIVFIGLGITTNGFENSKPKLNKVDTIPMSAVVGLANKLEDISESIEELEEVPELQDLIVEPLEEEPLEEESIKEEPLKEPVVKCLESPPVQIQIQVQTSDQAFLNRVRAYRGPIWKLNGGPNRQQLIRHLNSIHGAQIDITTLNSMSLQDLHKAHSIAHTSSESLKSTPNTRIEYKNQSQKSNNGNRGNSRKTGVWYYSDGTEYQGFNSNNRQRNFTFRMKSASCPTGNCPLR